MNFQPEWDENPCLYSDLPICQLKLTAMDSKSIHCRWLKPTDKMLPQTEGRFSPIN